MSWSGWFGLCFFLVMSRLVGLVWLVALVPSVLWFSKGVKILGEI